jgi:hypothetical protein
MEKGLTRRNALLNKRKCTKEEEKELRDLMKKFPFGSREGRLEAARMNCKGVKKLLKKFTGK